MSMQSSSVDGSAEDKENLPPMIVLNQRPKIKPMEVINFIITNIIVSY